MDQDRFDMEESGSCLLADVHVEGNLKSDKDLYLEGIIRGDVCATKRVTVEAGAVVEGNVDCDELYINGQITGNVCVASKAVLGKGAVIKGGVETPCLEVTPGAVLERGLKLKNASK